ncbi:MAG: UDP-N-acetylglucosamine--LPS N-acetylglucosamine transferase [Clostridia bacterium]|nr:UDP-N-acetylglucosamine--LPS N-acetylglucosamine transferase [Clostridia bacterium]
MDVLILSVSAGGGHLKAGEAIKEVVEYRHPGSRVTIIDTLKYVNPILDKLIVGSYLNTVKNTPKIYGKLYEMSETGDNLGDFSKTVNKLLSYKIKSLIDEYKPSVVVCTHLFPLQMMSNLKRKNKVTVPTASIITDFVSHSMWIHDNIDAYVVAHNHIKYELIKKGIPQGSIYPYGIPVSSNFLCKNDKDKVRAEFGLDDKLTFLIMGGSLGFGEIRDTFRALIDCKEDIQIIALTGKNTKLKRQLEKHSLNSNKTVKILSYTNRVADLMDVSDFLVTKPGGMTISEALVKQLPMFLISPIPGQEEGNAHFLLNNGAAARLFANDDIDSILYQITDNPLRLKHMKEMAAYLAKPNASSDIVDMLENLIKK